MMTQPQRWWRSRLLQGRGGTLLAVTAACSRRQRHPRTASMARGRQQRQAIRPVARLPLLLLLLLLLRWPCDLM